MKRTFLGIAMVIAAATAANAQTVTTQTTSAGNVLGDERGMTLYTYDRDTQGGPASSCEGNCLANWPPFLAADGAAAHDEWTLVDVTQDGAVKKMWAYNGWPLYFWVQDTAPGQATGDGRGGVWHVVAAQ